MSKEQLMELRRVQAERIEVSLFLCFAQYGYSTVHIGWKDEDAGYGYCIRITGSDQVQWKNVDSAWVITGDWEVGGGNPG